MGLCLSESLIRKNGMDLVDQLKMYSKWMHESYLSSNGRVFDIGRTCRTAINRFGSLGKKDPFCGPTERSASGNGSLMRLAAVPMFFKNANFVETINHCGESSRTTHGSELCIQCCRYYGGLIKGALQMKFSKEELLSEKGFVGDYENKDYWKTQKLDKEIEEVVFGCSYKKLNPCEGRLPKIRDGGFKGYIVNAGYVVKSMEAALWGFYHSKNFKDGLLKVVNNGHDADTVGAIYGMLAGAYYGYNGIPESWRKKIRKKLWLTNYSLMLYSKSKQFQTQKMEIVGEEEEEEL